MHERCAPLYSGTELCHPRELHRGDKGLGQTMCLLSGTKQFAMPLLMLRSSVMASEMRCWRPAPARRGWRTRRSRPTWRWWRHGAWRCRGSLSRLRGSSPARRSAWAPRPGSASMPATAPLGIYTSSASGAGTGCARILMHCSRTLLDLPPCGMPTQVYGRLHPCAGRHRDKVVVQGLRVQLLIKTSGLRCL